MSRKVSLLKIYSIFVKQNKDDRRMTVMLSDKHTRDESLIWFF